MSRIGFQLLECPNGGKTMPIRDQVGVELCFVQASVLFLICVKLKKLRQRQILPPDDTCHLGDGERDATERYCDLMCGIIFRLVKIGGEVVEQGETILL